AARGGTGGANVGRAPQVSGRRGGAEGRASVETGGRDPSGNAMNRAFVGNVVLFGRMLKRAGLSIDPDQTRRFADVLALLGFDRRGDVKAAGRAVFVRRRDERGVYDAAFDLFWRPSTARGAVSSALPRLRQQERAGCDVSLGPAVGEDVAVAEGTPAQVGASAREALRTADFAGLTPAEARDAAAMLAALRPRLPLRPSRRPRLGRRGRRVAPRAMLRTSLGAGGEPLAWRFWQRRTRPRPIVLVCDIS